MLLSAYLQGNFLQKAVWTIVITSIGDVRAGGRELTYDSTSDVIHGHCGGINLLQKGPERIWRIGSLESKFELSKTKLRIFRN
jgi:hypothetical protein